MLRMVSFPTHRDTAVPGHAGKVAPAAGPAPWSMRQWSQSPGPRREAGTSEPELREVAPRPQVPPAIQGGHEGTSQGNCENWTTWWRWRVPHGCLTQGEGPVNTSTSRQVWEGLICQIKCEAEGHMPKHQGRRHGLPCRRGWGEGEGEAGKREAASSQHLPRRLLGLGEIPGVRL